MSPFVSIQVDLYGIIILLVLYFKNYSIKEKESQKLFNMLLFSTIIILILDISMWLLDGTLFKFSFIYNYAATVLYYAFTPHVGFAGFVYCNYKMHQNKNRMRKLTVISLVTYIFYFAASFLSIKTGWMFVIDENNVYHRGPFFWVSIVLTAIYLSHAVVDAILHALRCENKAERREYVCIAGFMIPPAIGATIQLFVFGVSTNWVGAVISILILFITLQNNQISTDPLTGLNNRRTLYRTLETKTANLSSSEKLFALVMDLDGFKGINDTYGHASGDAALVDMAAILKEQSDIQGDFLARMGGDEFCILCIRYKGVRVPDIISDIYKAIDKFNITMQKPYKLSVSIGVAAFGEPDTKSVDSLMNRADNDMYAIKEEKKRAGIQVR